jgi:hypothetical protein
MQSIWDSVNYKGATCANEKKKLQRFVTKMISLKFENPITNKNKDTTLFRHSRQVTKSQNTVKNM